MPDVTIREADVYDIPYLQKILRDKFPTWEHVDFHQTHTIIAEYQGQAFASCSARLVWQIEPLMVFDDDVCRQARLRGIHQLLKKMEAWISDPQQNTSGIFTYVCHLITAQTARWAERLGMTIYCYFGSKTLSPQ